jgi:hypothetical protein
MYGKEMIVLPQNNSGLSIKSRLMRGRWWESLETLICELKADRLEVQIFKR